jgi:cobalt-precorrin-5B (C1)-methyltransferase
MEHSISDRTPLRRGWTTGACAAAAAKAAFAALITGRFPDPVTIRLPRGHEPAFALAETAAGDGWAAAGVIKDAGDDPDVTHGMLVRATVRRGSAGAGISFRAGEGVGTVTKPGLPLAVGEPAINPMPRKIIRQAIEDVAEATGATPDAVIEIAIPGGAEVALQTWNPRLGILGGLSVLGTTGIVVPYSCAAWIASIHRGVDVARASGLRHVAAATGRTSEDAVQRLYGLEPGALLDMGDFAGALLKYLRRHPLPRLTIAGGFAKLSKLAQGRLDLHSGRSQVDLAWLAGEMERLGGQAPANASSAGAYLAAAEAQGLALGDRIAAAARASALGTMDGAPVEVDLLVMNRSGRIVGRAGG